MTDAKTSSLIARLMAAVETPDPRRPGGRGPEALWYYWLNGKQGHATGNMWAATEQTARMRIHSRHGDQIHRIDRVWPPPDSRSRAARRCASSSSISGRAAP